MNNLDVLLLVACGLLGLGLWLMLPRGTPRGTAFGLLLSTVYLRHHYVVDLIAGACLVPWILWLQPRVTRWWGRSA